MTQGKKWLENVSQNNYQVAWDAAADILAASDLDVVCSEAGAERDEDTVKLRYFGTLYSISVPGCEFEPELSFGEQILVLHYLVGQVQSGAGRSAVDSAERSADPSPGGLVSFSSLPGGMFYAVPFRKRSVNRIVSAFGNDPDLLATAGAALGGRPAGMGDASVDINAFPLLRIVAVIHAGDDELPADGDILFPDACTEFLSLEDLAVLAGVFAGRLVKAARK